MLPILTDSILPASRRIVVCPSDAFSILNIGRMLLSRSDEAVGIDSGDNPDADAEVIGSFSCATHHRSLDSKICAPAVSGMRGECHL